MGHSKSSTKKASRVSLQDYRKLIVRSGLLTSDDVRRQYADFVEQSKSSELDSASSDSELTESVGGEPADKNRASKFARHLENQGLLTRWQNANLLRGRLARAAWAVSSWLKTNCYSAGLP